VRRWQVVHVAEKDVPYEDFLVSNCEEPVVGTLLAASSNRCWVHILTPPTDDGRVAPNADLRGDLPERQSAAAVSALVLP